eukprot:13662938-Alexandrium_andersonii.AAC.1
MDLDPTNTQLRASLGQGMPVCVLDPRTPPGVVDWLRDTGNGSTPWPRASPSWKCTRRSLPSKKASRTRQL